MNYDDLKRRLDTDLLRLDQEMTQLPFLVQEAAEIASEVFNDLQKADFELDLAKANAGERMRNEAEGKAPSETRIATTIILDPEVQEAQKKVNDLKYQARLANDLVSNLRDKSRLLGKISDLVIAGYIQPNSRKAYQADREKRMERPKG